jgi:hypothetical protein
MFALNHSGLGRGITEPSSIASKPDLIPNPTFISYQKSLNWRRRTISPPTRQLLYRNRPLQDDRSATDPPRGPASDRPAPFSRPPVDHPAPFRFYREPVHQGARGRGGARSSHHWLVYRSSSTGGAQLDASKTCITANHLTELWRKISI